MQITTKIRIYPTSDQAKILTQTTKAYTQACNHTSAWIYQNKNLKQRQIHDALYHQLRELFGLGAQMSASAIRTVIATYKTIHASEKKWVRQATFKRHRFQAVYNRDYTLTDATLSLGSLEGRLKLAYSPNPNQSLEGKLGTATIHYKHGKWMMHIPLEIETQPQRPPQNIVGVDRGIRHLAVTYDSHGVTTFYPGAEVKNKRAYYKDLRTRLQKRQTRSARKRLQAIGSRENRWMSDVNHRISKALVTNCDSPTLFVLEDLTGIRGATTKVKRKNRYTQVSWAYYQLGQYLRYKAEREGHRVIEVNPAYTSQTCPVCAHVSRKNRVQKHHAFTCVNCGYRSNDDRVAAMNLHFKGRQYLVQSQLSIA